MVMYQCHLEATLKLLCFCMLGVDTALKKVVQKVLKN